MAKCTWVLCEAEATQPQIAKDGEEWANLCQAHHDELDSAGNLPLDARKMVRAFILAQGGHAVMAKRMDAAVKAGGKLFEAMVLAGTAQPTKV